ncbi:MAG TPA: hypothetical protein VMD02_04610 [Candidatus Omnitrophota bacterium]|nr:hypothetical protein [Candidatus Omnitrophota bacterium]
MNNIVLRSVSLALVLSFIVSVSPAFAMYGARPLGMGGAFTAIANDANAAYWNPAGFAVNPGTDLYGTTLLTNRNVRVGDNLAALKMCFEAEVNPYLWAIGVGAVSLMALEGAKYLSDLGILKKNWGRDKEKEKKDEAVTNQVLQSGDQNTVPVGKEAKEKLGEAVSGMVNSTLNTVNNAGSSVRTNIYVNPPPRRAYWGPYYYPWYHYDYDRPTYWDHREDRAEQETQGSAQFGFGLTWLTDHNSDLRQDTNFYTLSLATGYEERVALGANLNFYDLAVTALSGSKVRGYGAGVDMGLLARPVDQVSFGLVAKELLTTDVYFENGATFAYQMEVNAGIALDPIDDLTLACDVDNIFEQGGDDRTMHYGAEYRPFPGLALRAGLSDGNKTAGASVMVGSAVIDYAYLGGAYDRTQILGLTWKM